MSKVRLIAALLFRSIPNFGHGESAMRSCEEMIVTSLIVLASPSAAPTSTGLGGGALARVGVIGAHRTLSRIAGTHGFDREAAVHAVVLADKLLFAVGTACDKRVISRAFRFIHKPSSFPSSTSSPKDTFWRQ